MRTAGRITNHSGCVTAVCYASNGSLLASSGADMRVRVYSTYDLTQVMAIDTRGSIPSSVAFSHDSSMLSYTAGNAVVVISIPGMKVIRSATTAQHPLMTSVSFNPDDSALAIACGTRAIILPIDAAGRVIDINRHSDMVNAAVFNHRGDMLATASDDSTVKLISVGSWVDVMTLVCMIQVSTVAFSSSDDMLVASSWRCVQLWSTFDGMCLGMHDGLVGWNAAVAFNPNGRMIATCGKDNAVDLVDVESMSLVDSAVGHTDWVTALCFSPDGRQLASGSVDGSIVIWDIS